MAFWKRKEQRAEGKQPSEIAPEDGIWLGQLIGSETAISKTEAMSIPAVAGCINIIAGVVSMLPIRLFKIKDEKIEEIKDDRRVKLLNGDTGDLLDAVQMKQAWIKDYLLDGAGYIYINRTLNQIEGLHYVANKNVSVTTNTDPVFKDCDIWINGNSYREFDILRIVQNTEDGVTGIGLLKRNKTVLSVAYHSMLYEENLVKTGGNKKGFLKSSNKLEEGAIRNLREAFRRLYRNNSENIVVLNDGLDFKESSNTSVEMQLNENKKSNSDSICHVLNVPPEILSGNATEVHDKHFIKYAISPILKAIETALNKSLLLRSETDLYFKVDTDELIRGDIKERFEAYQIALDRGFMQMDEVRQKENMNPLGLDFIKLGLQDVLYDPKTQEIYTPNTNKTSKISVEQGGGDKTNENGD